MYLPCPPKKHLSLPPLPPKIFQIGPKTRGFCLLELVDPKETTTTRRQSRHSSTYASVVRKYSSALRRYTSALHRYTSDLLPFFLFLVASKKKSQPSSDSPSPLTVGLNGSQGKGGDGSSRSELEDEGSKSGRSSLELDSGRIGGDHPES